jgi:hypothetical protein
MHTTRVTDDSQLLNTRSYPYLYTLTYGPHKFRPHPRLRQCLRQFTRGTNRQEQRRIDGILNLIAVTVSREARSVCGRLKPGHF